MDSNQPQVGIVVLNFNGENCLLTCLTSLSRLDYSNFFVVVVDNASRDSSLASAQASFPTYTYIRNAENKGFAGGMNVGMSAAFARGAEWVWLFNNDATTEESALKTLMAVGEQAPRAGLLSPCISDSTGGVWFGKGRVNTLRMRAEHVPPSKRERSSTFYPSEFLTGCALLVKREVFERIGDLDDRFFLYYEDVDFSVRVRVADFQVLVVPGARVFHGEQSRENDQKVYYLVYSGLLFFKKHANFWENIYFSVYGTIRRLKNAIDVLLGKEHARMVRRAYHDFSHDS